jgi:hypothetical protein
MSTSSLAFLLFGVLAVNIVTRGVIVTCCLLDGPEIDSSIYPCFTSALMRLFLLSGCEEFGDERAVSIQLLGE